MRLLITNRNYVFLYKDLSVNQMSPFDVCEILKFIKNKKPLLQRQVEGVRKYIVYDNRSLIFQSIHFA